MDSAHQAEDGAGVGELLQEPLGPQEDEPLPEKEEGVAPEVAGKAAIAECEAGGAEGIAQTKGLRGVGGGRRFSHQRSLRPRGAGSLGGAL